tara:strand:- start:44 stop:340 length:297 start_codon:yes stop_codon:yes gene_type:complete
MNHEAIYNTHPSVVTIRGDHAFDADDNPVTLDQVAVDTETARFQAEYDSQEYARKRSAEYPSIDELIVALWEGVVEERMAAVTSLEGKRQAVKAKYPK